VSPTLSPPGKPPIIEVHRRAARRFRRRFTHQGGSSGRLGCGQHRFAVGPRLDDFGNEPEPFTGQRDDVRVGERRRAVTIRRLVQHDDVHPLARICAVARASPPTAST